MEVRHDAIPVPDLGGYSIERAEMNPMILDMTIVRMKGLPQNIWEPFSAPSSTALRNIAVSNGVRMVSYGLLDVPGVEVGDSRYLIPAEDFGCVLIHPPYYGSSPQSNDDADLSNIESLDEYCDALLMVMRNAAEVLVDGGILVAVGRDYRAKSERIRLDLIYKEMMESLSLTLEEVWTSEPDVVLIARKVL